ncbi:WD40 repeat [Kalmanozyma brasiliensis GHG001]|uniref:Uncharacterized protein n=1 Tax=Kalmanozyma brasiliensis (strain GHG001) TaxID=1365824 RepID=V5EV31_KALBG|nr:WD40 repeat [Kalmanozyma brasiliensis GHG001]EST07043.1 WD40 repeat [Kalmanozyma brasiliensis GHG001]
MAALPYISVQPNYADVFSDVSSSTIAGEKVWLSYYSSNAPSSSVHVKLPLLQTKDDGTSSTQGSVSIGELESSGGPPNGLSISRVPGSWLDLSLTQTSPANSEDGRSARSLQPNITLDPNITIRFPKKTLTHLLPTQRTSKVNDNYTNHPTIEAFDLSLGTAVDETDLFVAGGSEGALYTSYLSTFDTDAARAEALSLLTPEERDTLAGESDTKWELEARVRTHVNAARARVTKKTALKGHVGDVRCVKFFPSNRVVLSTSSDLTVRVWDAFTGDNPRTFRGHKRAVLAAGIVGRGRTVLTGGADGSVRLWDVGADKQARLMGSERFSAANCLALKQQAEGVEGEQEHFVVGLASGGWQMFDLRTATASVGGGKYVFPPGEEPGASEVWTQTPTAGVTAIDVAGNTVVTGTTNGIVSVWDLRHTPSSFSDKTAPPTGLVTAWRRNNAEVNHLRLTSTPNGLDVLVATQDGLPYRASLAPNEGLYEGGWTGTAPKVVSEYAGWDCDQTSWIGLDRNGRTVIAGAEGAVRRY